MNNKDMLELKKIIMKIIIVMLIINNMLKRNGKSITCLYNWL